MSHETTSQALADLVRDETSGEVSQGVHAAGRARWLDAVGTPRRRTVSWAAAVAAAAVLALVLAFYLHGKRAPLAFTLERSTMTFTDGTRVVAEASARVHVAEVTSDGARLVLEDGALDVDVAHRVGARWTFEAGPYAVAVTGTAFVIKWSAPDGHLYVEMARGSVRVDGPNAAGVAVVGGQTLDASPREITVRSRVAAAPIESVAPVDTVAPALTAETQVAPPIEREARPPTKTWSDRVTAGEYAAVVREAEDARLEDALARRPLSDLAALADAARYAKRFDVASRALSAERTRFPNSAEARAAAFMLGRTAEDAGDAAGALGHYDDYLRESPDGTHAAEALGRKLVLLRAQKRLDEARPVAREYLRRFPAGGYSHVANEVVSTP